MSLDELLLGKAACIEQEIFDVVASMPEKRKHLSKKIPQTMLEDEIAEYIRGMKMSNSYFSKNTLQDLLDEIQFVYLSDKRP